MTPLTPLPIIAIYLGLLLGLGLLSSLFSRGGARDYLLASTGNKIKPMAGDSKRSRKN